MNPMSVRAKRILARLHMGDSDAPVDWALVLLEEGYDSENLRILAGLGTDAHRPDIDFYFAQTMQELGWELPGAGELLRLHAEEIARRMLDASLSLTSGSHQLQYILCYETADYSIDLSDWGELGEGSDYYKSVDEGSNPGASELRWAEDVREAARKLIQTAQQFAQENQ